MSEGNLAKTLEHLVRPATPAPDGTPQRRVRSLLGWLSEHEGVTTLLGHPPMLGEDVTAQRANWQAAHAAVQGRTPYSPGQVVVTGDRSKLDEIARRPELAGHFSGLNWRIEMVDLEYVLSFQKVIILDGANERIGNADRDEAELFNLCIPVEQDGSLASISTDPDGKGFAFSSLNPNLRIAGSHAGHAQMSPGIGVPPLKVMAFTLFAFTGSSYLQVVRYRDRCFVRDGYHRATALLRRGVRIAPCIFIEARNLGELGCPQGSLTEDVLYGDRPPRLADFWDDTVAREVSQPAIHKVIRIRGDEFVIAR